MKRSIPAFWSRTAGLLAFTALSMAAASPAASQSLIEMYRAATFKAQADRVLAGYTARVMPPEILDYPTDSLREWVDLVFPPEDEPQEPDVPRLVIHRWEIVPKLGREWFQGKFKEVRWTYVGSNSLSQLDTTFTRELRARLEAEFGSPTQTIADLDHSREVRAAEYIQFEYWFVLNDSIPLMVMDVNGPFERGLVVASADEYRDALPEIKDAFLGRIAATEEKSPYADYYHLPEQRMWFLTGYDGEKYILKRISKPDLKLGRPLLEKVLD